jgi:hypothetical protein
MRGWIREVKRGGRRRGAESERLNKRGKEGHEKEGWGEGKREG